MTRHRLHPPPPALLTRMEQRMPGLEIIIATGNTPEMLGRVLSGGLDPVPVTMAGRVDRALEARRLMAEPLLADVPVALLPAQPVVRPAALAALPLNLFESGGATRGLMDAWFGRAGLAPRPIMELGSVESIKVLVESGLGATIMPRSAMAWPGASVPDGMRVLPVRPAVARCLVVALWRDKLRDCGLRVCLGELEAAFAPAAGDAPATHQH